MSDVFISYSVSDKVKAGVVQDLLNSMDIECFLAHEDIDISEEWQNRIVEELRACKAMVYLASKAATQSEWCLQETGIARLRDIPFIPLSLDGDYPRGFVQCYQAGNTNKAKPEKGPREWDWTSIFLYRKLFPHFRNNVIRAYCERLRGPSSFASSEFSLAILEPLWKDMDAGELQAICQACLDQPNNQVIEAGYCRSELLPKLLRTFISSSFAVGSVEQIKQIAEAIDMDYDELARELPF